MRPRRIRRDELAAANPLHLDPLESLNAAWAAGFLRAVGLELDDALDNDLRVTVRKAAFRDQYRAGIRSGREARGR